MVQRASPDPQLRAGAGMRWRFALALVGGGGPAVALAYQSVPERARSITKMVSAHRQARQYVEGSVQGSKDARQGLCDTLAASADLGCVHKSIAPFRRSTQQFPRRMLHVAELLLHCWWMPKAQIQTRLVAVCNTSWVLSRASGCL